jgi:NADH-quinone oxidoreductase subunit N
MWAPDVYEGAPTPISALFAAVPKLGLFLIGIKIFYVLFYDLIFFLAKCRIILFINFNISRNIFCSSPNKNKTIFSF